MTGTEAIAAVRASTLHDSDTQVTNAQILVKIALEYRRFRRVLQSLVPTLYQSVTTQVVASGSSTITKPALTERVWLLEKQLSADVYYPVTFVEQNNTLVISPASAAPGTYRLTVVVNPAAAFVEATVIDVPEGCEDILVERTAAWVRQRHDENAAYHLQAAADMWKEQKSHLVRRYGQHAVPGLVLTWR